MEIKRIKGTRDYYGIEAKKLNFFFSELDQIATKYSFNRAYAPTIEDTKLFSRAVGNETDVVNKEMYSFNDKKDRSMSLRPEGTAQIVRLAIENKLLDNNQNQDIYYIENMFRYERPQKGRQREFFQFGVESFGQKSIYKDLEVVLMAKDILDRFGIDKYDLQINSIGSSEDRVRYNEELSKFISERENEFSDYAKDKIKGSNVLRVLDSKNDNDLKILEDAPKLSDWISEESKNDFNNFKKLLDDNGIKYNENPKLVRGLDYYNDLVFEFISTDEDKLGAKATLIAGGRYDNLVSKLEPSMNVPAIGFAMGIERMMLACEELLDAEVISSIDYYIATAYSEAEMCEVAINLSKKLRSLEYNVVLDTEDKKLAKKLDKASKLNSSLVIIVGNEIKEGNVTIKELDTQVTETKKIEEI